MSDTWVPEGVQSDSKDTMIDSRASESIQFLWADLREADGILIESGSSFQEKKEEARKYSDFRCVEE